MVDAAEAYSLSRMFPPADRAEFRFDRHYLLYCTAGTMRLEAEGKAWTLPPSRAAIIVAGQSIHVTLPQTVMACSALFDRGFIPPPAEALTVINMTPLARELILACRIWTDVDKPLDPYARQLFTTLAAVASQLAATPSNTAMPLPRSDGVTAAMRLTEQRIAAAPDFASIARDVAMTERSLARHFLDEMGMTWRQTLRRLRVIRAMEILGRGNVSIIEASYSVGYASPSAFNAAFLEITGQTPSAFRLGIQGAKLPHD
jgi:AraC-like DNA-binding protein